MEKSKKIICIILAICALSALCAVCASAVYPSASYSCGYYSSSAYVLLEQKNSLPCSFNWQDVSRSLGFSVSSSYSEYIEFSVTFYITWWKANISTTLSDYLNSLTVIYSDSDPISSISSFSSCSLISTQAEFISNSNNPNSGYYNITCLYSAQVYSLSDSGTYFFRFPSFSSSGYDYFGDLKSVSITSSSPPEPPPDPADPSSGSSEGALLDGFTWAQNIGYYASFSPLLNSSTLEPSYLGVTRMSRLPYDQITDSKFQAPSSSNGCALIMGQKTDYSDILVSGTVGYGVCAMLVTSPFKLDSSTLGVDYTAQIFFASGDDPSASGYTQVDASTLGLEEYTVRVWTIDYNEWSKIVMCRYYFVLDLGVSSPSFPTDTISVQFKSTAVHTHEWYWTPFDFRFQYALRESESDPLPDSVTNYNPATGSPTSTGGYNTSESTVSDNLNQEAEWASKYAENIIFKNVGGIMDNLNELVDYALFGNNLEALESLKNALTYSSTGGTIYLPEATIPFGGSQLHLWDRQAIPFSDYINQIPSVYTTIFSFLLIVGGWFAFAAIWFNTFRKLLSGDVRNERF